MASPTMAAGVLAAGIGPRQKHMNGFFGWQSYTKIAEKKEVRKCHE
jgi:hypothetical protein